MNSCLAIFLALLGLTAASRSGSSTEVKSNPVSRIVNLLNGLKGKLEEDLKAETDLYETYKCWYKTTTETKKASNEAAGSRIDSLKSYIADIEAGKIEFTTERVDLEKQIASLSKDLETAKTMRDNENKDFVAAETEMKQAVAALDEAITTIEDGTKDSLVQKKSYIDMLSTRHAVQKTMAFARGFLNADDQKYLEQFLNHGPEDPDWKKLNKKATHKMKYAAASGKIKDTLKKLRTTFANNLEEATTQEADALATYETLKTSKKSILEKAQQAKTDMVGESGARGLSKQESQDEVDALEKQKTADITFISEAETAFTTKETEWEARKELRSKEILAMSQAIAVLASDDAKDQFKESFKSQGYMFLQELVGQSEPKRRAKCAARLVHSLASKSSDPRLALLEVATGNEAIDKVVVKIDEIVAQKKTEETEDLEKKQTCETDLSDAASKSRAAALEIDTASEDVTRAESQIEELKTQITEQEEKKTGLQDQVKELKRQREDENTRFKSDKIEDQKAVALVEQALGFIKDWKNAKAALIAQHKKVAPAAANANMPDAPVAPSGIMPAPPAQLPHRMAAAAIKVHTNQQASAKQAPEFQVEAGAAPVPPPATWDAGATYEGAGSEQGGIVGILGLVKDDMEKDITTSETDEAQAVTDYDKTKADLEGEITACDTTVSAYTQDKAEKEKTVADKTEERGTKKGELDSQVELYKGYRPGCDFLLINFDIRTKSRLIEIDGLEKAKAILKGADFGSSLLQEMC